MKLECDDTECDSADVTEAILDSTLASDGFGNFAILSKSEDAFVQIISDWSDTDACREYVAIHESEPYTLVFGDGETGEQFQADPVVSLAHARRIFVRYLHGDTTWRSEFTWQDMDD